MIGLNRIFIMILLYLDAFWGHKTNQINITWTLIYNLSTIFYFDCSYSNNGWLKSLNQFKGNSCNLLCHPAYSFLWCLFEGDYIIIPIYKGSLIQTWCLLLNLWYLHLEQPLEKGMCIVRSESSGESSIEKNIILNRIN